MPLFLLAQNWSTGTGGNNARNSYSTERGPAKEELLWQNGTSSVIAQQALVYGDVVVTSRIFDIQDVENGTQIVAQCIETGELLWTAEVLSFSPDEWRSRVCGIDANQVYVTRAGNTNEAYLYALDISDGELLWRSEDLIDQSSTENCNYASNGDLIIGNNRSILRVNHEDGTTVWQTPRQTPTSNGQEVAIHENLGIFWQPSPTGPTITLIDLETGDIVHESEAITPGLIQQIAPFFGHDGTIYTPRSANNPTTDSLMAWEYIDNRLVKKWSVPMGYVPFSSSAVSPSGIVYSYNTEGEVMKINSAGEIIATSFQILSGASSSPRMCLDAAGRLYVTNGEFDTGALFVFDSDLELLWTTDIRRVNVGGPAMGKNGTLVVCGVGNDVRAYRGVPTHASDHQHPSITVFPNPVVDQLTIKRKDNAVDPATVKVYNSKGQNVHQQSISSTGIISTLGWAEGTYTLLIYNNEQLMSTIPFIKIKN